MAQRTANPIANFYEAQTIATAEIAQAALRRNAAAAETHAASNAGRCRWTTVARTVDGNNPRRRDSPDAR